jgi:hypothetical protein
MQGAPREPAARQCPVDCRDIKGQHSMRYRRRLLDPSHALAQFGNQIHVLFLFF